MDEAGIAAQVMGDHGESRSSIVDGSAVVPSVLLAPDPGRETPIQVGGLKENTPPVEEGVGNGNDIGEHPHEAGIHVSIDGQVSSVGAGIQNGSGRLLHEVSLEGGECGACLGRHRKHICGRERLDEIPKDYKDPACAACMGRHRPHTCKKGRPEHLRGTIKRKKSGVANALGSQQPGPEDASDPKQPKPPKALKRLKVSAIVGAVASSELLAAHQNQMGGTAETVEGEGMLTGEESVRPSEGVHIVDSSIVPLVVSGGVVIEHGDVSVQDHEGQKHDVGYEPQQLPAEPMGGIKQSRQPRATQPLSGNDADCGACTGRHRRHNCGRERLSSEPDPNDPKKDPNCHACCGRHRPHSCGRQRPKLPPGTTPQGPQAQASSHDVSMSDHHAAQLELLPQPSAAVQAQTSHLERAADEGMSDVQDVVGVHVEGSSVHVDGSSVAVEITAS